MSLIIRTIRNRRSTDHMSKLSIMTPSLEYLPQIEPMQYMPPFMQINYGSLLPPISSLIHDFPSYQLPTYNYSITPSESIHQQFEQETIDERQNIRERDSTDKQETLKDKRRAIRLRREGKRIYEQETIFERDKIEESERIKERERMKEQDRIKERKRIRDRETRRRERNITKDGSVDSIQKEQEGSPENCDQVTHDFCLEQCWDKCIRSKTGEYPVISRLLPSTMFYLEIEFEHQDVIKKETVGSIVTDSNGTFQMPKIKMPKRCYFTDTRSNSSSVIKVSIHLTDERSSRTVIEIEDIRIAAKPMYFSQHTKDARRRAYNRPPERSQQKMVR